ncbi:MAG: hypothetical protein HRT72_10745 [Flavobacteriales bacterium]|nr:hypothetical protein [Flavobacteriales bacterium]
MPYVHDIKILDFPPKALSETISDTLKFTIYFKRNEHKVDPIIRLFNTTGLAITSAQVEAYSSVEGTKK